MIDSANWNSRRLQVCPSPRFSEFSFLCIIHKRIQQSFCSVLIRESLAENKRQNARRVEHEGVNLIYAGRLCPGNLADIISIISR
uniref:Uncharacterized protein n=1 Tax=Aegilops tauschii subsp. strangulata TaxID=200361 RepID=A0A453HCZ4_AEGTS